MSAARAGILRDGLDLPSLHGVEIGALSHPVVRRADGPIVYVDHTDTAALRRHYAGAPHVNAADIVEVDAIWGERTLSQCLDGRSVDYVIASHVAEHVPDLITWLAEIRDVLRPRGQLRLALPDKRFSTDALRCETRPIDLLAAWLLRPRRPQPRDVLDNYLFASGKIDGWGIFEGRTTLEGVTPNLPFDTAAAVAAEVRDDDGLYHDVHCLVVQAGTFARLMAEVAERGLLRLACARMVDTAMPLCEFYVFMMPCDDTAEVAASWRRVAETLHDPLPGSHAAREADARAARFAELLAAETELARLKASASWRLTAPLRRLRSRLSPSAPRPRPAPSGPA